MSKIAILKDPDTLREGIFTVIKEEMPGSIVRVFSFSQFNELKDKAASFDLLILDMETVMNKISQIDYFLSPQIKIVVWISQVDNKVLTELFKKGLDGYFFNGMQSNELVSAIKAMLNNKQYIHPFLSPILLDNYLHLTQTKINRPSGILTKREWEVLEQIVKGNKNSDIADCLCISITTVKNHILSILKKLNVSNRTNAALLAVRNRWFAL
ncbi:response regulator transcription factor [Virgibacillus oceani]